MLFKDDDVGAVEVVIDPANPQRRLRRTLEYASSALVHVRADERTGRRHLQVDRRRQRRGSSSRTDCRRKASARTGIAIAPSNPRRVYRGRRLSRARSERSAAGGRRRRSRRRRHRAWRDRKRRRGRADSSARTTPARRGRKLSSDQALWGRGWYFEKVAVDPKNADIVYVPNVSVSRSKDGGKTWVALRGSPGGDDYHQAWVSPDDSNTMIVASDQGTIITRNAKTDDPRDVTWSSWLNQPTAQIYHLSVDYRFPYWVTGAQQDSGAVAVRSRGKFAEISMRDWEPIGAGGESGMTAGDPLHPGIIFGGTGQRFDLETNTSLPRHDGAASPERRRARIGRSRSCSRRPIRTRSTTRTSTSSRRPTARRRGRRSAPISRAPIRAFRRRSTRRPRRRSDRNGKRGVDLHDRAVAARRADALGRHRRRLDSAHDRRRQDVAERDAARRSRRGVASRRSRRRTSTRTPRTRASTGTSFRTSSRTSIARATWARRGRRSRTACPRACTCTS